MKGSERLKIIALSSHTYPRASLLAAVFLRRTIKDIGMRAVTENIAIIGAGLSVNILACLSKVVSLTDLRG